VGGFRSGKKHRFREFLPARSPPTMTARADPHGYSAKSASSPDGIRPALRKWKGGKVEKWKSEALTDESSRHFSTYFSTFQLFHFST